MAKYDMDMDMDEDMDGEALSFSSMICHATPSPEHGREPLPPVDPSFEFRPSPDLSFPSSPADGHLHPDAPLLRPLLPRSFRSLPDGGGSRRDLRRCLKKEAGRSAGSSQKKVSFQLVATEFRSEMPPAVARKATGQVMGCDGRRGWEAASPRREGKRGRRGLFGYFMSSCRECHALEPSSQVIELQYGWAKRP